VPKATKPKPVPVPVHVDAPAPTAPTNSEGAPSTAYTLAGPDTRLYVGDCRDLLKRIPECANGEVDMVFADPPFNWNRAYDQWDDAMPRDDYLAFTRDWLDLCIAALRPKGSLWVNIPDDTAAEIVVHLKSRHLTMVNWCIWHYRFGQNRTGSFINSKVHVLYFAKDPFQRTWNPEPILEPSDRATTYFDKRTMSKKDGMPPGKRVPLDVWYGPYWGRIQGTNTERRHNHDNQIPETYLNRVIRCSSNEGDLVLDPFTGSGTTGVVARALKRRFIGTEFSDANARSAFERIKAGPARPLDADLNHAAALLRARKPGKKVLARQGHLAGADPNAPLPGWPKDA
jgi:site-specific DNA-methyltransferase (adenine-specific)